MTDAERLEEAKDALHKLEIGRLPVTLTDQNGEKIEYNYANRLGLINYIRTLERSISPDPIGTRGPMRPVFR